MRANQFYCVAFLAAALVTTSTAAMSQTCNFTTVQRATQNAMGGYQKNGIASAPGSIEGCYKKAKSIDALCSCSAYDLSFVMIDITQSKNNGFPGHPFLSVESYQQRHLENSHSIGLPAIRSRELMDSVIDGVQKASANLRR